MVYLVPAEFQMTLKMRGTAVITSLTRAHHNSLSPSVDITMESAAKIYDGNTLGIILSGMGRDGCIGMKAIKISGGRTIAQDETSLIFGMPKEVINAGYADKTLPVEDIVEAMIEWAGA